MIIFHPLAAIIPGTLLILIVYGFMLKMSQEMFSKGEPFSSHAALVSIITPKMVFGVDGSEQNSPTVAILGKIKNESNVPWEDIKLEAQFFDKDENLIDTTQQEKYSFMVPAQDESSFKLSFKREFPQEKYVSFKVRIISAKDERTRF